MKKILIKSLTVLTLLTTSSLMADEITDQINEGLKAYEEKDYKGAIEELKFALAQIEELKSKENNKLLPKPLKGWTFKESKDKGGAAVMAMFGGGGSSMKGDYEKDNEHVEIEIVANSPLIAMVNMAITNPAMISNDPSSELYRYKRIKGIKKKEKDMIEITLVMVGQIMIKLTGKKLKDEKVLEGYLDSMDMKKIKEELL